MFFVFFVFGVACCFLVVSSCGFVCCLLFVAVWCLMCVFVFVDCCRLMFVVYVCCLLHNVIVVCCLYHVGWCVVFAVCRSLCLVWYVVCVVVYCSSCGPCCFLVGVRLAVLVVAWCLLVVAVVV